MVYISMYKNTKSCNTFSIHRKKSEKNIRQGFLACKILFPLFFRPFITQHLVIQKVFPKDPNTILDTAITAAQHFSGIHSFQFPTDD